MALKIVARPVFETTVVVNMRHLKGDFKARFVALRSSAIKAIETEALKAGQSPDEALLLEACEWFETVELPEGPLPYVNADSLLKLLDYPGMGPAMTKAYYRGQWEEAQGN